MTLQDLVKGRTSEGTQDIFLLRWLLKYELSQGEMQRDELKSVRFDPQTSPSHIIFNPNLHYISHQDS